MVVIGLCRKWLERFRGQIGKQGNVQATETATSRDIELGEQQKIAACLGSLDDWIAAEGCARRRSFENATPTKERTQ